MSKLNEFISEVKGGMAKSHHFAVQLTLPSAISNLEPIKSNMNKIILFCDQAQLPGVSYSTNPVRSYGEVKEVPYEKLFEQVNLSFYVDADLTVKKLFDEWIALVQDPVTRDFNYPSKYISDSINILIYDNQNQERYRVALNKVFPKAIAPVQLDYANKDVMKLQVTLSYQFFTTQQTAVTNEASTDVIGAFLSQMPDFGYGFDTFTEIPTNYFNDFTGFQNQFQNLDFSYGGVKSLTTYENIGELTGFGGIFV